MKALEIEFDLRTGVRAGGINPKNPKFRALAQDLESEPAREIRLVTDETFDFEAAKQIDGITVLDGKDEINERIVALAGERYSVFNEQLLSAWLNINGVPSTVRSPASANEQLKGLYDAGCAGVVRKMPNLL